MKAAVIREFGDVEVLKYEDIEIPKPRPGQFLIKVLVAGELTEVAKRSSALHSASAWWPSPETLSRIYVQEKSDRYYLVRR